jgi:hypothetical protein
VLVYGHDIVKEAKPSRYNSTRAPVPYNHEALKETNGWVEEYTDRLIPEGFVSDFICYTKEIDTVNSFAMWVALTLISSVIKREGKLIWLKRSPLYPNLFVLLIAPPSLLSKTITITYGAELLRHFWKYLPTLAMRYDRFPNIIEGAITPQGLRDVLTPAKRTVMETINGKHKEHAVDRGSQGIIINDELVTLLDKKKQNTGLIELLTDLYDCKDSGGDTTRGEGTKELKNTFVTLLGGGTPVGLDRALPDTAFGGGFISRLVTVFEDMPVRMYDLPEDFEGIPDMVEMAQRLAWIAENFSHNYTLSPEAQDVFIKWRKGHRRNQIKHRYNEKMLDVYSRQQVIVPKVALLLRAQRYRLGDTIEAEDVQQSIDIVEYTMKASEGTVMELGESPWVKARSKITKMMVEKGRLSQKEIAQKGSTVYNAKLMREVLSQLHTEGAVRAWSKDGKEQAFILVEGSQYYTWEGFDA